MIIIKEGPYFVVYEGGHIRFISTERIAAISFCLANRKKVLVPPDESCLTPIIDQPKGDQHDQTVLPPH